MRPKTGVMSPTLGTSSPARQARNLLLNLGDGDLREQLQWLLQPLTAGKQVHHDNLLSLLMNLLNPLLNLVDVDLSDGDGDLMEQLTAGKLVRHDNLLIDLRINLRINLRISLLINVDLRRMMMILMSLFW